MKIINESGKEVIDDFINEYSSSLKRICSNEVIRVISEIVAIESDIWVVENLKKDPMSNLFSVVVYNQPLCVHCGLTNEETYTLLFHEIGHRVHNLTEGKSDNQQENEMAADAFACMHSDSIILISALRKVKDNCDLNEQEKQLIQERIAVISEN